MNTTVRTVLDVAVRVAVLLLGLWAFTHAYEAVSPEPVGADIGEGLLSFMLMIGLAGVWGAWDGHHRDIVRVAVTWVVTAFLTGGWLAFSIGLGDPGNTVHLMLASLVDVGPFQVGLIAVPALLGAGLGALVRATTQPPPVWYGAQPPVEH